MRRFSPRGICVSIAFFSLISFDQLRAQTPDQDDKPADTAATATSAECDPRTGGFPAGSAAPGQSPSSQNNAKASNKHGWVHEWFRRVDKARSLSPHFVSPIVTTHVMLVQQYRFDMSRQTDAGDGITSNYGASRGLEIIPATHFEVGLFPPNYLVHQSNVPDGFGDFSWQVKYRAFSAPEEKGDYFVGFFMGGSFPTGRPPNGLGHTILSPTFAAAKGLGPWDIQSTIGANLPVSGANLLGRMIIFNTAVDYRIKGRIWPMLEQNSTFWSGGTLDGNKEVFLTPGIVFGPFPVVERLHFLIGGGVQIAVTHFHRFNHRWILSLRFPF
jgi:hypothetical protein